MTALQSGKSTVRRCIGRAEVAQRLRARMDELRKNQTEFAEMLGISQPMLSQVLAEERAPSEEALACLKLRYVEHYEEMGK
jgi:predicted transcriptional regulator